MKLPAILKQVIGTNILGDVMSLSVEVTSVSLLTITKSYMGTGTVLDRNTSTLSQTKNITITTNTTTKTICLSTTEGVVMMVSTGVPMLVAFSSMKKMRTKKDTILEKTNQTLPILMTIRRTSTTWPCPTNTTKTATFTTSTPDTTLNCTHATLVDSVVMMVMSPALVLTTIGAIQRNSPLGVLTRILLTVFQSKWGNAMESYTTNISILMVKFRLSLL